MIQTPTASETFSRNTMTGDNFYKFRVVQAETRHVQIDLLDISTLYRHVVSYFIRCNRTEYLRDTAIFAKSRLYLYANVSVKLSNVLYRGGSGTMDVANRIKFQTSPSFTVYTEFRSHLVEEGKEGGSCTIDEIKISDTRESSYCLVSFSFLSFFPFSARFLRVANI